jgi:uncharacterized protein
VSDRATWTTDGRPLLDTGEPISGRALVLDEPLSFWGGVDQASGAIIDGHHPQAGEIVAARVLVMPAGRGSSSSSSVLAESIRAGYGPAAIILRDPDEILVLGALVAQLLDGTVVPVLVLEPGVFERIATGDSITVRGGGRVEIEPG